MTQAIEGTVEFFGITYTLDPEDPPATPFGELTMLQSNLVPHCWATVSSGAGDINHHGFCGNPQEAVSALESVIKELREVEL